MVIAVKQTISEFEKEIELLQTQKIDVEKHVQSQKREMRGNENESLSPWVQTEFVIDVTSEEMCPLTGMGLVSHLIG